jgi:sugar-specific transcriptional regulator TrmB
MQTLEINFRRNEDEMILHSLEVLGFSASAARMYKSLVEFGQGYSNIISRYAKVDTSYAYTRFRKLVAMGAAREIDDKKFIRNKNYVACRPIELGLIKRRIGLLEGVLDENYEDESFYAGLEVLGVSAIDAEVYRALAKIDGSATLQQLSNRVGFSESIILRHITRLSTRGMAEIARDEHPHRYHAAFPRENLAAEIERVKEGIGILQSRYGSMNPPEYVPRLNRTNQAVQIMMDKFGKVTHRGIHGLHPGLFRETGPISSQSLNDLIRRLDEMLGDGRLTADGVLRS